MLDVIIGRHTWDCQIRTHIHTGIHTHTQSSKQNYYIISLKVIIKAIFTSPFAKVTYWLRHLHKNTLGCGWSRVRNVQCLLPNHFHHRWTSSPHHKGDMEIGVWPGLSESSGPKYSASHRKYFCGDALTGRLL